jgi:hypothetical protein
MSPELVEAPFDRLRAHDNKCALRAHDNKCALRAHDNKCALSLSKRPSTGSSAHRYFGLPQPTA